ncbi:hypothetical protein BS47DRAFT_775356 [Hydnum rufescens UP504]|uniref:Uncharacterized protein n=1 Tax=Hydnum rufescens UP504 TaxID=1448309 RepID=A0A9P6B3K3_9AGAM|nr:hypothetical protein BS47DRAFT_775356 [Hydnum rufescens UP504]
MDGLHRLLSSLLCIKDAGGGLQKVIKGQSCRGHLNLCLQRGDSEDIQSMKYERHQARVLVLHRVIDLPKSAMGCRLRSLLALEKENPGGSGCAA